MYIKSIYLKDFGIHENLNIEFSPGSNVIIGENARGKSTVIEAIQVALFGTSTGSTGTASELVRTGAKNFKVILTLSNGVVVTRTKSDASISENGEAIVVGSAAVTAAVLDMLNLSKATDFLAAFVAKRETVDEFLSADGIALQRLIERLQNIEDLDAAATVARTESAALPGYSDALRFHNEALEKAEESLTAVENDRVRLVAQKDYHEKVIVELRKGIDEAKAAISKYDAVVQETAKIERDASLHNTQLRSVDESLLETLGAVKPVDYLLEDQLSAVSREKDDAKAKLDDVILLLEHNDAVVEKEMVVMGKHCDLMTELSAFKPLTAYAELLDGLSRDEKDAAKLLAHGLAVKNIHETELLRLKKVQSDRQVVLEELAGIETEIEVVKSLLPDSAPPADDPEELLSKASEPNPDRPSWEWEINRLERIGSGKSCPTCGQDTVGLCGDFESPAGAIEYYRQKVLEDKARVKSAQDELNTLRSNRAKLRKLLDTKAALRASVTELVDQATLDSKQAELDAANHGIEGAKELARTITRDITTFTEERNQRIKLEAELAALPVLEPAMSLEEVDSLRASKKDLEAQLTALTRRQAALSTELTTYNNAVSEYAAVLKHRAFLEGMKETLENTLQGCAQELAQLAILEADLKVPAEMAKASLAAKIDELSGYATHLTEINWQLDNLPDVSSLAAHIDGIKAQIRRAEAAVASAEAATQVVAVLRDVRKHVLEGSKAFISDVASAYTTAVTYGELSEVVVADRIGFVHKGTRFSRARASGAQRALITIGIKRGLAGYVPCTLRTMLFDEITAAMSPTVSSAAMAAIHSEGLQTISVSFRDFLADKIIQLS